jgi:hypothetical protein
MKLLRREFTDDIGKASTGAMVAALPDEWKADMFKPSLTFNGAAHFHRPGVVTAWDLVVAVPSKTAD